jgi:hypothetical protein
MQSKHVAMTFGYQSETVGGRVFVPVKSGVVGNFVLQLVCLSYGDRDSLHSY